MPMFDTETSICYLCGLLARGDASHKVLHNEEFGKALTLCWDWQGAIPTYFPQSCTSCHCQEWTATVQEGT